MVVEGRPGVMQHHAQRLSAPAAREVAQRRRRVVRHPVERVHRMPCVRDVKDKYTATRVHLLSAFLRAKDPIDKTTAK